MELHTVSGVRQQLRCLAAIVLFGMVPAASAAWFDEPAVVATVSPGLSGTDPHYLNLSEDGAYLLVDWHSSNAAFPAELYSVAELKALSGATNRVALASALAGDFFGAGTGDGGWKGGAISARLGVAIPGSGKGSGAAYTAFDVPALGWKAGENAFQIGGLDGAGFDGLDFNAAGTRLYVNQYASGSRNKILAYDTSALKSSHALSLLSTKTVEGVTRIRNLSCYTVKGRDLVYFGEGAVSGSNNSVYVYDPAEDTVTALVTDATLFDDDIMNVKLSHVATGCPTMYVQTDNGRLHVFLLAPDGKSVTSAKPAKSFTPAECAALCGLAALPANASYVKFRNFEVADDGDVAFFAFLNGGDSGVASPGLCVVKSGSTEDAYIAAPNRDAALFTDYFFGANSRIEVDFRFLDTANGFIFSPWEAGSGKRCGIWRDGGTYKYFVGDKGGISSGVKLLDTERHTVVVDAVAKKGHLVTGTTTNTTDLSAATFGTSSWPIMFLGAATGSTGALRVNTTHYARARIYGAKIYESGVLVRDYVPAVVNGVPCLYDRANGSIAADTRDDAGTVSVGGNVPRLTGDVYLQLDPANSDTANKGINTGYRMTAASRVEADFQISNPPGDCRPFGAWNGASGSNRPLIYINSKIIKFFLNTGGTPVNTGVAFDDGRQSFALDATDMTFYLLRDGIVHWGYKSSGSAITAEQTRPLALFADANSEDGSAFQSPARGMKCWSFKISEGGTLVTNFLPHLSIDGACMKDALTGKVITPKVPRHFTYRLEPSGTTEGYVVKTTNEGATGFMTDWKFDAKSKVEGEFTLRSTGTGQRLFGSWQYNGPLRTLLYTDGSMKFFINSSSPSFTTPLDTLRHRYVIDFTTVNAPTGYCYTGGALTTSGGGTALANTTDRGGTVAIMADGGADGTVFTQSPASGARFWGMKAYESGQLVHDWVPAKKDGVVGIADKRTGVLLAANTANFAAGGDLWECTSDAYVESSGNMVIDTGYHAKKTSRIEVDMMPLTADQVCYYGSYGGNNGNAYTFWNGNPYVKFNMKNTARDSAYRFCPLSIRFTAVTDFSDQTQYVVLNGEKIDDYAADFSSQSIAEDWESRNPMGVCGAINDSGICTGPKAATMRCYAVRIYENDALVHLFVPYSGAEGVGLVDLLTGDKAFKHAASTGADPVYVAGPLAVSAEEIARIGTARIADFVLSKGKVRTVTASAQGASTYRWTRNGTVIGETDGTFGIGYRKSGETDVFTVTPIYRDASGSEMPGTASTFSVTYSPPALVFVVRSRANRRMRLESVSLSVGAEAPFRALLSSDNHLCRCDASEAARNPRKAELARKRSGVFPAAEPSFAAFSALVRSRPGELLLHAGDLSDFVSGANLVAAAAFWREAGEGRPVLAAPGNHEFSLYVGEAPEDEAYKAQSAGRVRAAWPNDLPLASLVHGGVLFVALDNAYYLVSEAQRAAFRREAARGLPTVLLCHNPFWEEDLAEKTLADAHGRAAFLCGAPDAALARFSDRRAASVQAPDATTRAFLADLRATPGLRAVLAGHVHRFHAGELFPGVPQICSGAGFRGEATELLLHD